MVPSFLKDAANRGWKVARLDDLLKSKDILGHLDGNHGNLYPRSSEFVDSGIKYISANALIDGKVNLSKSKYLMHERGAKFKKGVAIDGDVLFAHNATVGPVALLTTNDDYVILSTSLTYYRCALDKVDNKYLVQYMASPAFVRQYEKIMKQTTRNQIPITAQRDFYFVLPPLPEQRKIAQILSTWDKAIATTEKLIDASKQQKKSLMQQLLTGKKRLVNPDTGKVFEGEWETMSIAQLITESRLAGTNGELAKKITVKLYGRGVTKKEEKRLGSESTKYYKRKAGQFIYSKLDFLNGAFGIIPQSLDGYESTLDLPAFDFTVNVVPKWFIEFVSRDDFYTSNLGLANGGRKARRVNPKDLLQLKVRLPSLIEQQKIATVLTATDKEIELLEAKLAHFKQEKKALMQQLLTGKCRVKVEEMEVV